MQKHLSILLLFCLISVGSFCQTLKYTIKLKDEVVGTMTAKKTVGAKSHFLIESSISVEKIIKIDLFYKIESFFEKNILLISTAIQNANGKEYTNTTTEKKATGYTVTTTKENKNLTVKAISYNLCKLYFEEPVGVTAVWSDSFGEMLSIKPAGSHRYELVLADGKSNFYTYYKGICILVETEIPFGKITFRLTK